MTTTNTTTDLLSAEAAATLTFPNVAELAAYADYIGRTIQDKVARAKFAAQAAAAISSLDPTKATPPSAWYWEAAEAALPSPLGAQELFGSVMQGQQ